MQYSFQYSLVKLFKGNLTQAVMFKQQNPPVPYNYSPVQYQPLANTSFSSLQCWQTQSTAQALPLTRLPRTRVGLMQAEWVYVITNWLRIGVGGSCILWACPMLGTHLLCAARARAPAVLPSSRSYLKHTWLGFSPMTKSSSAQQCIICS